MLMLIPKKTTMDSNNQISSVREVISELKLTGINSVTLINKIEQHSNSNLKTFCSSIADLTRLHFDYNKLAVGILVNDLHNNLPLNANNHPDFSVACQRLTDANVFNVDTNDW